MTLSRGGRSGLWATAANLANVLGPDGPPSNVTENQYGNGKYYYTWTNYDASYQTQYSISTVEGARVVEGTLGAGVTSVDTITQEILFAVRHVSGGLFSAWATAD